MSSITLYRNAMVISWHINVINKLYARQARMMYLLDTITGQHGTLFCDMLVSLSVAIFCFAISAQMLDDAESSCFHYDISPAISYYETLSTSVLSTAIIFICPSANDAYAVAGSGIAFYYFNIALHVYSFLRSNIR